MSSFESSGSREMTSNEGREMGSEQQLRSPGRFNPRPLGFTVYSFILTLSTVLSITFYAQFYAKNSPLSFYIFDMTFVSSFAHHSPSRTIAHLNLF